MSVINELTYPLYAISRLRMLTDGKGITSLVGSVGCPLSCKYCINPESWNGPEKIEYVTAEELYERVKIDNLYFLTTGGGLTFGGGEPLLHADFISEFVRKYGKTGWKFYVETSLNVPSENVKNTMKYIDAFSIDCKDMNPERYKSYTGGDYYRFEENLKLLLKNIGPDKFRVRVPYIEGYNTREQQHENAKKLKEMGVINIQLFDYVIRKSKEEV